MKDATRRAARTMTTSRWLWGFVLLVVYRVNCEECTAPRDFPVSLNEVFYDGVRLHDVEYFEVKGPSNFPLEGLSFVVIDSTRESQPHNIMYRYDYTETQFLGCNGHFLVGNDEVLERRGVEADAALVGGWSDGIMVTMALVETASIAGSSVRGDETVLDAVGLLSGRPGATPYFYFGAPVLLDDFPVGFYRDVIDDSLVALTAFDEALSTPTASTGDCDVLETVISRIQGIEDYPPPLLGRMVNITAVCIGDFQSSDEGVETKDLGGFYVQEERSDQDRDSMTSEGIFVQDFGVPVTLGDLVQIVGRVDDVYGETQLVPTSVTVLASGQSLPSPTSISLSSLQDATRNSACGWQPDLERYEGMLVEFSDRLAISDMSQLHVTNAIKLIAGDRPYQYTQFATAPSQDGYEQHVKDIGRRTIVYDDGLAVMGAEIDLLQGFGPDFRTSTAPRMGDTISRLQGVLTYKSALQETPSVEATWRLRRHGSGRDASFSKANPRPRAPFKGWLGRKLEESSEPTDNNNSEGEEDRDLLFLGIREVRVASFNLYNFFTTLKDGGHLAGPRAEEPMGAVDEEEYTRQLAKIVEAFLEVDADVYALQEVENEFGDVNGDSKFAIGELVKTLNDETGGETYAYIDPGQEFMGPHAVTNGFIYNRENVFPIDNSTNILDFDDDSHAPVLVQSFGKNGLLNKGRCVTIGAVQLASRSGEDCAPEPEPLDGSGRCDAVRREAVSAILEFEPLADSTCRHTLLVGDFNAFAAEAPVSRIVQAGYKNLQSDKSYSYVSDNGQVGTLDYAFVRGSGPFSAKAEIWHINEDEAYVLDYRTEGRNPEIFDPYTPARFSDHSPIVVEIRL